MANHLLERAISDRSHGALLWHEGGRAKACFVDPAVAQAVHLCIETFGRVLLVSVRRNNEMAT